MSLELENPLCSPLLKRLLRGHTWKIHTLAASLDTLLAPGSLDSCPNKDLFKRNFLIMNALYQLQGELASSEHWLHISGLQIELRPSAAAKTLTLPDPLREYYLNWCNYETSGDEVAALLDDFWLRFGQTTHHVSLSPEQLHPILERWQLPHDYSLRQLNKSWRKHALMAHPDRESGNKADFQRLEGEYHQLRARIVVGNK